MPIEVLREKASVFVEKSLITADMADRVLEAITQERNHAAILNEEEQATTGEPQVAHPHLNTRLSAQQMKYILNTREGMMREGSASETYQWRVYKYIVGSLERGELLRLMIQASAGTGKSFLLTSVYLWCLVNGMNSKSAAPTGIAAANVEIEGTDVSATTVHNLFEFDQDYTTKLDFSKVTHAKVAALIKLQVLLLDEVD